MLKQRDYMATIQLTTSEELQTIIANNAQSAVLVDFYGESCPPCKLIAPFVDKVAREYSDTFVVVKVQGDQAPSLCEHFNIQKLPTLFVIFKNQIVYMQVGSDIQKFTDQIDSISSVIRLSRDN